MLLSLMAVWIVWPLHGTIAARNIALVLGAISSIGWLYTVKPKFEIVDFVPIAFLICVPVWLLGLYIFNPAVPYLQWDDLRGTWFRVLVGIIFAIGLGGIFSSQTKYENFFAGILIIWPVVLFVAFINEVFFAGTGLEYFIDIFKSKIACVYFLMWSILFIISFLHFTVAVKKEYYKYKYAICFMLLLFLICLVDLIGLRSLNGFLILLFVFLLFAFFYLKNSYKNVPYKKLIYQYFFFGLFIWLFLLMVWYWDGKYSQNKLHNFYLDVKFILNDDISGAWKWDGSNGGHDPFNHLTNNIVNGSTYQRVTWFMQGVEFLKDNPLGLGYTSRAFMHYMAEQFPGSRATKTHSGWLDFALGAGIMSLLCLWSAICWIIFRAWNQISKYKNPSPINFFAFWSLLSMFFLWQIGELSEREYIEHFFFLVAFFSISVSQTNRMANLK